MRLTCIKKRVAKEIARIHFDALPGDVLPQFGVKYLQRFYMALKTDEDVIFIEKNIENEIVGFLFLSIDLSHTTNYLIRKTWFFILINGIKLLITLKTNKIRKTLSLFMDIILKKKEKTYTENLYPEIYLIAVEVRERGKGIGRRLVDEPNLIPMFNSYCWAAALYQQSKEAKSNISLLELPAISNSTWRKGFPKAGLIIDKGLNHYTIVSWHKGGVLSFSKSWQNNN